MDKNDGTRAGALKLEWAQENVVLSVARTYGSWARTGMAAIGVALGMHFVFREPSQLLLGQLIATLFVAIAVTLFLTGNLHAHQIQRQLDKQHDLPFRNRYWPLTLAFSVASALILLLVWSV